MESTLVPGGGDEADLAAMLGKGHAMVREGQAMIRAAENMGARAKPPSTNEAAGSSTVNFDALPGASPKLRAEALYMGRRIRDRLFPNDLFSEPAWDIMLKLFLARRDVEGVAIEPVLTECGIPRSTGLRIVALLEKLGLVDDSTTTSDDRTLVSLSHAGFRLMKQFFELTDGAAVISRGDRKAAISLVR